jgi:hypothetical protein
MNRVWVDNRSTQQAVGRVSHTSMPERLLGADTWLPSSVRGLEEPQTGARGARPACGYAGCTASWSRLFRRTGRPRVEGRWGCSRPCLRAIVDSAVRRELSGPMDGVSEPHRHRVPLGLVLLAQGWITNPQLQHALAAQRAAGRGRIGDWLVEQQVVSGSQVTRGLGLQWNCPVLSLAGFNAARMALTVPLPLIERLKLVPVRLSSSGTLYVGAEDRLDAAASLALERMMGLPVECGLLAADEFDEAAMRLQQAPQIDTALERVADTAALTERIVTALTAMQPVAARLVRVHTHLWLRLWLDPGSISAAGMLPTHAAEMADRIYDFSSAQFA